MALRASRETLLHLPATTLLFLRKVENCMNIVIHPFTLTIWNAYGLRFLAECFEAFPTQCRTKQGTAALGMYPT